MLKLEPNGCSSACRIHHFEKVEQFFIIFLDNNKSWEAIEEMHVPPDIFKVGSSWSHSQCMHGCVQDTPV